MPYHFRQYSSLSPNLLADWEKLWDSSASAHPFNSPQWFLACRKMHARDKCLITAAYDGAGLAAIVPLVAASRYGIKTFVPLGGRHVSKSPLLAREADSGIQLIAHLAGKNNLILPELDEETAALAAASGPYRTVRESSVNPYVPLAGDPLALLSKKQRSKILNKISGNQNHLSYECFKGSRQGLELAFRLERRSSRRSEGKPVFTGNDTGFFLHLLSEFKECLTVDVLYYDREPIVFSVGFGCKKTYHACNTAHNEKYKHLSPRKLLVYHMYRRLKDEGYEVLDFSRGMSPIKRELTPYSYRQYDLSYSPSVLTRAWWNSLSTLRRLLLGSGALYRTYLSGKGLLTKLRDRWEGISYG